MSKEQEIIEAAFVDRVLLKDSATIAVIEHVVAELDAGNLRVASPPAQQDANQGVNQTKPGEGWTTHAWVKKAILLYFGIRGMQTYNAGPFEFHDKIPLKKNLAKQGVRVVPPGVIRYGAFCEPGVIVMPGYVNIGARVGSGTMVDTWATVGSCAQIGRDCHLSGGVGIGGVLEPPGARPVIVEDGCFIGSRVVVVEGMHIGKEAVIGTGVVLTSSTPILDVSGRERDETIEYRGYVPARSVVIPGVRTKKFAAGEFGVTCALIIGQRKASTDRKVSLNDALRDFAVPI
jgi:2,3,4,5-tetrahydropyridine-2-carboxylate N-succinyltransferase